MSAASGADLEPPRRVIIARAKVWSVLWWVAAVVAVCALALAAAWVVDPAYWTGEPMTSRQRRGQFGMRLFTPLFIGLLWVCVRQLQAVAIGRGAAIWLEGDVMFVFTALGLRRFIFAEIVKADAFDWEMSNRSVLGWWAWGTMRGGGVGVELRSGKQFSAPYPMLRDPRDVVLGRFRDLGVAVEEHSWAD